LYYVWRRKSPSCMVGLTVRALDDQFMPKRRVEVHYRGRVQGVGFRQSTCDLAENRPVAGSVKNLPDGRVHLIAEGEEAELEEFLQAITGRMGRNIHDCSVSWRQCTDSFSAFHIEW
jgi:acylphosphatase